MHMPSKKICKLDENTQHCVACGIDEESMSKGKCRTPHTGTENPFAYASVDLETTGLDTDRCQILQCGIVLEDFISPREELPAAEWLVLQHGGFYYGQSFAMQMNAKILKSIADVEAGIKAGHKNLPSYCYIDDLTETVEEWLKAQGWKGGPLLCVGKNFGSFDRQMLINAGFEIRMHHRSLDPVTLYYDPFEDWNQPPNMKICCERANVDSNVKHEALADAYQVIELLRSGYGVECE